MIRYLLVHLHTSTGTYYVHFSYFCLLCGLRIFFNNINLFQTIGTHGIIIMRKIRSCVNYIMRIFFLICFFFSSCTDDGRDWVDWFLQ